jgi:hypothetical protein
MFLIKEITKTLGLMRYDMHFTKGDALFLVRGENCQPYIGEQMLLSTNGAKPSCLHLLLHKP